MYDSPKAVHFDAFENGVRLHRSNATGLRLRWAFVNKVHAMKLNMLHLTEEDHVEIIQALAEYNETIKPYSVALDLRTGPVRTTIKHA